jgi:thiosulfate dehydrogenase
LYQANCAGCHGALASSAKKGRTAAQIRAGMSWFPAVAALTDAELEAIAAALK